MMSMPENKSAPFPCRKVPQKRRKLFSQQTVQSACFVQVFDKCHYSTSQNPLQSSIRSAGGLSPPSLPPELVDISKLGLNSKIKKFSYSFIFGKGYSPPSGENSFLSTVCAPAACGGFLICAVLEAGANQAESSATGRFCAISHTKRTLCRSCRKRFTTSNSLFRLLGYTTVAAGGQLALAPGRCPCYYDGVGRRVLPVVASRSLQKRGGDTR